MLINMTKLFLRVWLAPEIQLLARRIFAVNETIWNKTPGRRGIVNTVNGDRVEVYTPCCHYNLLAPLR